jgi:hypothetical protein
MRGAGTGPAASGESGAAVADQQAANSEPCVTVTAGRSAPVSARAPAVGQVYSFGRYAPCFGISPGFGISPARSLPGAGVPLAGVVTDGCEAGYGRFRPDSGGLPSGNLPFRVHTAPGQGNAPSRLRRHRPVLRCFRRQQRCADAVPGGLRGRRGFADSHGPGWSSGGGLSRMLAAEASVMASQGGEGDRVMTRRVGGVLSAHRLCRQRLRKG